MDASEEGAADATADEDAIDAPAEEDAADATAEEEASSGAADEDAIDAPAEEDAGDATVDEDVGDVAAGEDAIDATVDEDVGDVAAGEDADDTSADGDPGDGVLDEELYRRTAALLEPGEVDLVGCVVHTDLEGDEDVEMMEATLEVGDAIAGAAGHDPRDVYVYSGNDDPEFASNQHQGRTIDGDAFVWECQQLLRAGTFDLVFYYEASTDHERVLAELRDRGYAVQGVEPAGT